MSSEISPQPRGRVVLGGAGGFMGSHLAERYRAQGREVVTIGRSGSDLRWDDAKGIAAAIDGAAVSYTHLDVYQRQELGRNLKDLYQLEEGRINE